MRMPTLRLTPVAAWMLALQLVPPAGAEARGAEAGRDDAGRPIVIRAQRLPPGDGAGGDRGGRLRQRTVLHLTSDSADFGGFSGLALQGRHLTAVSDRGHWLSAELELNPNGVLIGLADARMGRLCDDDGAPVAWERGDAEEVQYLPGRGFLVSFERHHRIVLYATGDNGAAGPQRAPGATPFDDAPRPFPFPPEIGATRRNKGMEAVALLADGRLMTFAEDLRTIDDDIIGWIGHPDVGDWRHLILPADEDFLPTGAALLPSGDVVLLVRSYRKEVGTRIRLLLLEAASFLPGGRLRPIELMRIEPPATIDNMEAVAVGSGPRGETLIYLLSDDNYNDDQRTLLMQFELDLRPAHDKRRAPGDR